jgi:hypothetical protein
MTQTSDRGGGLGWRLMVMLAGLLWGLVPAGLLRHAGRGAESPEGVERPGGTERPGPSAPPEDPNSPTPPRSLPWRTTVGSTPLLAAGVAACAAGVVLLAVGAGTGSGAGASGWTAPGILLLAGLAVVSTARARVEVDARGLRVRSAVFRFLLFRVSRSRIDTARVTTIEPMRWGGWGLRYTGVSVALVTRRGPGLVVDTVRGPSAAVTMPEEDARAAAAVLAPAPGLPEERRIGE